MKKKVLVTVGLFFILVFATLFVYDVANAKEKEKNPCPNGCIDECESFCVCNGPVRNAREANW